MTVATTPFGNITLPDASSYQFNPTAQAALESKYADAKNSVVSALQSGDYAGAFKAAEAASSLQTPGTAGNTRPLIQELETASGLQGLEPNKQWTQDDVNAYYQAAAAPGNFTGANLGENPYGVYSPTQWGDPANSAADALTNGASTPDIARYIAKQQPMSFADKWAGPIASVAIGALSGGLAAPLGATLGIGTAAGGALAGAGSGVVNAEIQGGNPLTGALTGGISGGIGASGLGGSAANALAGYGVNPIVAAGLAKGTLGAGVGALSSAITGGNAANGAITGGLSGAASGAINSAMGSPSILGTLGGITAGSLANKYLTSPPSAPAAAPAAPSLQSPTIAQPADTLNQGNVGSYSGYGYAPRTATNPNVTATYGQGPEANFFTSSNSNPTIKGIQPVTQGPTSV